MPKNPRNSDAESVLSRRILDTQTPEILGPLTLGVWQFTGPAGGGSEWALLDGSQEAKKDGDSQVVERAKD